MNEKNHTIQRNVWKLFAGNNDIDNDIEAHHQLEDMTKTN